jgi:predicted lipid-binding transport protein (Tim44 family)
MNENFLDIIILAVITFFIFLKLYNALGKNEKDFQNNSKENRNNIFDLYPTNAPREAVLKDVTPPEEVISNPDAFIRETLLEIHKIDPKFSEKSFLKGAAKAFEYIVNSFSNGDKGQLKPLLSEEIYNKFSDEIDKWEKSGRYNKITLVSVDTPIITKAILQNNIAKITVKFNTKQINYIGDKDGQLLDGNLSRERQVEENWLFVKDIKSRDPNWKLAATSD